MLDKLKKETGLTILMVSHDIERALKYADKVIEIIDGKVRFSGDTANFIQGGGQHA